jgi:hypothetical protein
VKEVHPDFCPFQLMIFLRIRIWDLEFRPGRNQKTGGIVGLEKQPRQLTKNIEAIPWQLFVERLWHGEFGYG